MDNQRKRPAAEVSVRTWADDYWNMRDPLPSPETLKFSAQIAEWHRELQAEAFQTQAGKAAVTGEEDRLKAKNKELRGWVELYDKMFPKLVEEVDRLKVENAALRAQLPRGTGDMSRERFCYVCGDSMGVIEDRYYSKGDTCGKVTCEREAREDEAARREQAHYDLDENGGWL